MSNELILLLLPVQGRTYTNKCISGLGQLRDYHQHTADPS